MTRISLLEKLEILKDMIFTDAFFIIIMISFIALALILSYVVKLPKKIKLPFCIGIYVVIIASIIIKYHSSFLSIIDYLVNNVFLVLIFPNIAVYGLVIILSNVILIATIFSNKISKGMKRLNIGSYCVIMFLLFLILNVIVTNSIDVYSSRAVYTNDTLFALIELNMGIFIGWILAMIVYNLVSRFFNKGKIYEPVMLEEPIIANDMQPVINDNQSFVDSIEIIDAVPFEEINNHSVLKETIIDDLSKFDNIEVIDLDIEQPKKEINKDIFTLDEYRMLANMLKNQRPS